MHRVIFDLREFSTLGVMVDVLFAVLQGVWLSLWAYCSLSVLVGRVFGAIHDHPRFYPFCIVAALLAAIASAVTLVFNIKYFPREEKVYLAVLIEIGTVLVTSACMFFAWDGIFYLLQQIF